MGFSLFFADDWEEDEEWLKCSKCFFRYYRPLEKKHQRTYQTLETLLSGSVILLHPKTGNLGLLFIIMWLSDTHILQKFRHYCSCGQYEAKDPDKSYQMISNLNTNGHLSFLITLDYYQLMEDYTVEEQIQELKHKRHIESVNLIKRSQYQVFYSPKLANSPYSHLIYHLKLTVPKKYPEIPPKLTFVDKVYHLNVETTSGAVCMPLLSDDWSPYLTLAAVFDSLDNILEEPDISYAASLSLKHQYTNQPQKYIEKVQQFIRVANEARGDMRQSVIEHVEIIDDSKFNANTSAYSIPDFISNCFEQNFENSVFSYIPKLEPLNTLSSCNEKVDKVRVSIQNQISPIRQSNKNEVFYKLVSLIPNKKQQQSHRNLSKAVKQNCKKKGEDGQSQSIQRISRDIMNLKQSNDQTMRSEGHSGKIQTNLRQANSLLNILIEQSNSMEQCIKKSQNSRVKSLLQGKQQRIIWMLEQTLEFSAQLRQQRFLNLRDTAKSLLI